MAPHDDPDGLADDLAADDELVADDVLEEIEEDDDHPMDSGDDAEGDDNPSSGTLADPHSDIHLTLQNDSIAFFDRPRDSVFALAQHPLLPNLVAAAGSDGPEDDALGRGFVVDTAAAPRQPTAPAGAGSRRITELRSVFEIDGHSDSISALAWTLPRGDALLSAGLDGRLRAYRAVASAAPGDGRPPTFTFLAEAREVPEINWMAACPSADYPNTVALGASDGSVWVYAVDPEAKAEAEPSSSPVLSIVQSYFLHTASCTAGDWTPDGSLLVTVSEDGSLYGWDVWGLAAAKGLAETNGATVVSMTSADQRFAVDGGLFALAVEPAGAYVAAGGTGGAIRVVSLPRVGEKKKKKKTGGGARRGDATGVGGQILASLQAQSDSVETFSFTTATTTASATTASATGPVVATTLLASGSVDGSIAVFDTANRFALRRLIADAHDGLSIVKVDFVPDTWTLTSCGMDGVVRRWDLRGRMGAGAGAGAGTEAGASGQGPVGSAGAVVPGATEAGLVQEWRGHRGGGEGGGVLGFVQGEGDRVVTAGDDGLVLVFDV